MDIITQLEGKTMIRTSPVMPDDPKEAHLCFVCDKPIDNKEMISFLYLGPIEEPENDAYVKQVHYSCHPKRYLQ